MCDSLDVLLPVITSEVIAPAVAAAVLIIKPLTAAAAVIGAAAAAVEVDDQIAEVKNRPNIYRRVCYRPPSADVKYGLK